jgi:hypothetical protein
MRFIDLVKMFRLRAAPVAATSPAEALEQSVSRALQKFDGMHKEHRELGGEICQERAHEELLPLMSDQNLMGSFSDMKHVFESYADLIGIGQVQDFVDHRLSPQIINQIIAVSTNYRVADDILRDDANMQTKSFMQAFRKAQQVYGYKSFFAAYIGVAAAVDYIQMDYELGADVDLGPDDTDDRAPPRRHPPGPS